MFFKLKPESLILGLATLVFLTPTAGAQSPPSWPTVVMSPTPAAVQVAPPSSESPDPAPTPSTTSSARSAAVAADRFAAQDGHSSRVLHENASRYSSRHSGHLIRANPFS